MAVIQQPLTKTLLKRRGKGKKSEVNEYEDECQNSFEQLSEKGEDKNPTSEAAAAHNDSETDISELEKQLKELQTERKKAYLRQNIEKERKSLRTLHKLGSKTPVGQQRSIFTGEPVHTFQSNTDHKSLQILSFIWPEPVEQFQSFTIGGEVEFRVGKQKTLDKVTIEEWGYANIKILQELIKQKRLNNINSYLNYTADIYRLAARNVWYSLLLHDKEYRQKQSDESFEWGSYRQDLRDFQLVIKRDNHTMHAFAEAAVGTSKGKGRNFRPPTDERQKARFYLMAEKFVEALITILVSMWNAELCIIVLSAFLVHILR